MTNIDLLNIVSSYLVTLPLVFFIIYRKNLEVIFKSIFVYLLICMTTETIYVINHFYFLKNTNSLTLLFLMVELVMLYYLFKEFFDQIFSIIIISSLIIYMVLIVVQIFELYKVNYSIFLGGNKIIILLMSINVLLQSFKENIPKWTKLLNISFLQYSLVGVTIYSFANFFIQNKEYVFFYVLINSLSNVTLYLLITYSMYLCRKQFSRV